jgi:Peptidase U49
MSSAPDSPKIIVTRFMEWAVPERLSELRQLWGEYDPDVILVKDAKRITLNANKDRISFDAKTIDVFWLICFSGWRAIECYAPHVLLSAATRQPVRDLISADINLPTVERAYKERRASAQVLIDSDKPENVPWPPDIPKPTNDRDGLKEAQDQASFDLTGFALAFALFHEFRHVMLDRDGERPTELRDEELNCDVWARDFLTAKLAQYANDNGFDYSEVLRLRSRGFALAALVLHEVTPVWDHGGNQAYFSLRTRMEAILDNTSLPDNDHFWNLAASLLIGTFRQKGVPIDAPAMSARDLTRYLVERT